MRKYFYIAIIALTSFLSAVGQRTLEPIIEGRPITNFRTISTNGEVIICTNGEDHLLKYNDVSLLRYNFPTFFGPLRANTNLSLASYRSATYLVLNLGALTTLFRFDGSGFTGVPVPGTIVAGPIVFGENLYVLSRRAGLIRLYRYNGTTSVEIPSANLPDGGAIFELRVAGNYLYLIGDGGGTRYVDILKRYDGTSTFTFPHFETGPGIEEIFAIGETGRAYILSSYSQIHYFNGTSLSLAFADISGSHTEGALWGDDLYVLTTVEPTPLPGPLHRINGTTVTHIPLPLGVTAFHFSNLAVYNDALFLQVTDAPGTGKILRYDRTSFADFFTIPGAVHSYGVLFLRDGNLIIQPEIQNDRFAYEYNGSTFTSIEGTPDRWLTGYLSSTRCNHLWLMTYIDETLPAPAHRTSIVKESKGCLIARPLPIIPRRILEFPRFSGAFAAGSERQSWSDIILNWENPVCVVPANCAPPAFRIALFEAQDNIVWEQKTDKPGIISVPLDGKLPYKTTLSILNQPQDLMVMDEEVVKSGITGIGFSMNAREENVVLAATTKQGFKIPLKVSLLNKDGKPIWEKEFEAPFVTNVKDRVNEPGEMLRFSIPQSPNQLIVEQAPPMELNYRNPSHGNLIVNVGSKETTLQGEIMISNTLGQVISRQPLTSLRNARVKLPEYRPGIFIITVKANGRSITNKMVWLQ